MHHPRTLGRDWLRAVPGLSDLASSLPPVFAPRAPPPLRAAPQLALIPTSEETRRLLGAQVHRMSRDETAAWNADDESERAEARRAIREAVRDLGGGELRDARGKLVERIG